MKTAIGLAAILGFVAAMASAQVNNFKYEGLLEVNKYYSNNTRDYNSKAGDKVNDQDFRANIGLIFEAGQNVNVQVNLINSSATPHTVDFGQAYLGVNNLLGGNHKFGRMFYGNPGDMIIYFGPDAWYVSGMDYTALEGWTGNWKKDKLEVNALIAKMIDGRGSRTDVDIYGVTANYALSEYFNPTAYEYQGTEYNNAFADSTTTASVGINRFNVYGLKASGKYKGVEYSGEYAMNSGKYVRASSLKKYTYEGTAMRFNAAYGFDLMGKAKVSGEYLSTSGDKNAADSKDKNFYGLNGNYRPGIINGAFNNPIGNTTTWNLGAKWTPEKLAKLALEAKYYDYAATEKVTIGANSYDSFGTEFDFTATWNYNEKLALTGYFATAMPDSKYSKAVLAGKDDNALQVGLLASLKF